MQVFLWMVHKTLACTMAYSLNESNEPIEIFA